MKQAGNAMRPRKSLIVCGAGGHASVVLDILHNTQASGDVRLFDSNPMCAPLLGLSVTCGMPDPAQYPPRQYDAVVAIGNCSIRKTVADSLKNLGYELATIVHPTAYISSFARIEPGTVVCAHAVVNPGAHIGSGCIINTGAIIEHDCNVAAFCHISPGAVLAGGVIVGEQTWVGANATVKERCSIGDYVVVGAGSFVCNDLSAKGIYFGSPARRAN